jgi:hypothetical protein
MANPTDTGRFGHRQGVFLANTTSLEAEIWCDRIQMADPEGTFPLTKVFELGRIGPVGSVVDPASFRLTMRENLHNSEIDSYIAGKAPATSGSLFNVGEMIANELTAAVVTRAVGATDPDGEFITETCVLESVSYSFVIRGPCTTTYVMRGKAGKWYTSGSLQHESWGVVDDVSVAGVNGRDARIFFTAADNRSYRLQRFNINVRFPVEDVGELGTRDLVGSIQDSPDVTLDFDVLHADEQPHDEWATLTSGYYDFSQLLQPDVWINVYNPDSAEASTVIKSFKIENVKAATVRPITAVVRGLATSRYTLSSIKEDTAGEGGMYVATYDLPAVE